MAFVVQNGGIVAIDLAVHEGIEAGAFPGALVMVGTHDTILLAKGYGHYTWSPSSAIPRMDSTIYDLASLTKVVATTSAIMILVDDGRVDLDAPVQRYLPEFVGEGKEQVTVRHLLLHRSGLRSFLPLDERASTADEARSLVLAESIRWPAGTRMVYSDLNAMLLGWIVQRVSGTSLSDFVDAHLFGPLGMSQTMFSPPKSKRNHIAPVGLWRGHVIAGELHDQNAVRLGGVSGHAGLYSTGQDLATWAQLLLNNGQSARGVQLFDTGTVQMFTERASDNRALGWEMNDTTQVASTGSLLSARAYGHGGYTGTSIWIDPQRDVFVILLTNRVFAPRTRRSITTLKHVRGEVADGAVELRLDECASAVMAARTRVKC